MLSRERCDYSALIERPPLELAGGMRRVLNHRELRGAGHPAP